MVRPPCAAATRLKARVCASGPPPALDLALHPNARPLLRGCLRAHRRHGAEHNKHSKPDNLGHKTLPAGLNGDIGLPLQAATYVTAGRRNLVASLHARRASLGAHAGKLYDRRGRCKADKGIK